MKLTVAAACTCVLTIIHAGAVLVQRHPGNIRQLSESHLMRLKSMPWSSTALLELAGDIDQMGLGQDPTGDLLGQIGKLIEDTMVPGILASRNSTQEQLGHWHAGRERRWRLRITVAV